MWHAVASVTKDHDPILYESPERAKLLLLNAGPGNVVARAWSEISEYHGEPRITVQLRPGDQRLLGGSLVRVRLADGAFAAVAWRVLSSGDTA